MNNGKSVMDVEMKEVKDEKPVDFPDIEHIMEMMKSKKLDFLMPPLKSSLPYPTDQPYEWPTADEDAQLLSNSLENAMSDDPSSWDDDMMMKVLHPKRLCDIINSGILLKRERGRTKERYEFLLEVANTQSGTLRTLAIGYVLQAAHHFPELKEATAKTVFKLLNINEESLRLAILKHFYRILVPDGYLKQGLDVIFQCCHSPILMEQRLAFQCLVMINRTNYDDMALALREYLNNEKDASRRKTMHEFLWREGRKVTEKFCNHKELYATLEGIYKDEFARVDISYVDMLFEYYRNSLITDYSEEEDKLSTYFVDQIVMPEHCPPPSTSGLIATPEINDLLCKLTVAQCMCTVMYTRSAKCDEIFKFIIDSLDMILSWPFDLKMRAVRSLVEIAKMTTKDLPLEYIDRLFDKITEMNPYADFVEIDNDEHFDLPDIDVYLFEPLTMAFYNLRHLAVMRKKVRPVLVDEMFKKKMRYLIRLCHIRCEELTAVNNALYNIPERKEWAFKVAAYSNVGLFAECMLVPSKDWKWTTNPSWRTQWNDKTPVVAPATVNYEFKP